MSDLSERLSKLSPEKLAILMQRLDRRESVPHQASSIPRQEKRDAFPLSFSQQRLWFIDQLLPGNYAYNALTEIQFIGLLDRSALERAINEIIKRHEALRVTFSSSGDHPVQIVNAALPIQLPLIDLTGLEEASREIKLARLADYESLLSFNLSKGPMLRAKLLRFSPQDHVILLTMHHIVADGWSRVVFIQEFASLYRSFVEGTEPSLPALPIQFTDFAAWQREKLKEDSLRQQLDYWKEQFQVIPPALELPTDHSRPAVQTFRGSRYKFRIEKELASRLEELSLREGATLFIVLLAAFKVLLMRYSGQQSLVVGVPIANRSQVETEALIGFFANTLALRTDLSGNPKFSELIARLWQVALGAYANQDLPFERLVEELRPERDLSRTPIFQVMFMLQSFPIPHEVAGLKLNLIEVDSGTSKFDLTLEVLEKPDGLVASLEYNTDLFNSDTIARMMHHFQILLSSIVANPQQPIWELPLLSDQERWQIVVEWNDTRADYNRYWCIHHLFENQTEQTPNRVAIIFGDERLTYGELNRRANRLARYLQAMGVGPEVLVPICVERNIEMIVSILGIFKAGGAYVPLDPSYPTQRLTFILEDAGAELLVTQQHLLGVLPDHKPHPICVDSDWNCIGQQSGENTASRATANNLAYTIYTSGSTGKPKGVAIEHRSAVAMIRWAEEVYSRQELAGVLASTSICFDLSVFEIFVPLSQGGTVIVANNALELSQIEATGEVTLINTVPSAMMEMVRQGTVPAGVRTVNLAGEALQNKLVQQIYEHEGITKVVNLYGPSEDTTYSTYMEMKKGASETPLIGRPISNTQAYILDEQMGAVPPGVVGELCISGEGLARGYLNRGDLTADRFIANPYSEEGGKRLYRTGDLAKYRASGDIKFLRRADHQVKVRGHRIELGEVEMALNSYDEIERAVVSVSGESLNEKQLIAYLLSSTKQGTVSLNDLHNFLKAQLPAYMIPSTFIQLDELPLLPNGKVDRAALPHPTRSPIRAEGSFVAPRNHIEQEISTICAKLLKVESLSIHDNFFLLGGHSLLSIQVLSRIRRAFGVDLSLQSFFESPTVAGLAEFVHQQRGDEIVKDQAIESALQSVSNLESNLTAFGSSLLQGTMPGQQVSSMLGDLSEEELLENLNDLSDAEVSVLLKKVLSEKSEIS